MIVATALQVPTMLQSINIQYRILLYNYWPHLYIISKRVSCEVLIEMIKNNEGLSTDMVLGI